MLIGLPRKTKVEEDETVKVTREEEGLSTTSYSIGKEMQTLDVEER